MGTKLVIKSADFSQDGIDLAEFDRTFDKNSLTWTTNKYVNPNTSGTPQPLSGFQCSDFIDVRGYSSFTISASWSKTGCYYDADKNFIRGVYTPSDTTSPTDHPIQSDVAYFRANYRMANINTFSMTLHV